MTDTHIFLDHDRRIAALEQHVYLLQAKVDELTIEEDTPTETTG
jgi:hypothetical protein